MLKRTSKTDKRYIRLRNSTIPCSVPCAKCIKRVKDPRYTKHFKNLSGLDWHVSHEHKGEPWIKDFKLALKQLARVLEDVTF